MPRAKKQVKKEEVPSVPKASKGLKDAVKSTFNTVVKIFKEQKGFHPMIHVNFEWMLGVDADTKNVKKTDEGGYVIMLADSSMMEARHHLMHSLGTTSALFELLGITGKPTMIRFLSEAWMSGNPALRPSEDPKRKESLVTIGAEASGATVLSTRPFTRTEDELILGKEMSVDEGPNSPLLNEYWDSYHRSRAAIEAENAHGAFKKLAQADPSGAFNTALKAAMMKAVATQLQEESREREAKKKDTKKKK